MPGWGYKAIKLQPQSPMQRVGTLIGDAQEHLNRIEAARPGFSVGDTNPTGVAPAGFTHLNKAQNKLWVYTDQGWVTADSYTKFATSSGELATSSTSYASTGLSVAVDIPDAGGFVHVYAEFEARGDAGGGIIEGALNDGIDLNTTRIISASLGTVIWSAAASQSGNSAGGVRAGGSWLVFWAAGGGMRTIALHQRSANGVAVRSRARSLYVLVF